MYKKTIIYTSAISLVLFFVLFFAGYFNLPKIGATVNDTEKTGENSQTFLKYFEGKTVINPSKTADENVSELSLGYEKTTFPELLEVYEEGVSNFVYDENDLCYIADFENNYNCTSPPYSNIKADGDRLEIDVLPTGFSENLPSLVISDIKTQFFCDFENYDYVVYFKVDKMPENSTVVIASQTLPWEMDFLTATEKGEYEFILNEKLYDGKQTLRSVFLRLRFTKTGEYEIGAFRIYKVKRTKTKAIKTEKKSKISSLEKTLTFENGAKIKTEDYFIKADTVCRKVTAINGGKIVFGGKIYDGKTVNWSRAVLGKKDGKIYALKFSTYGVFRFYKTKEDFLSGENSTTEENAKYWAYEISSVPDGKEFYIGISLSENTDTQTLYENISAATVSPYSKRNYEDNDKKWNEYLKNNDVKPFMR